MYILADRNSYFRIFFFEVETSRKPVSTGCSPFIHLIQFTTFITQNPLEFYTSATQTWVHYNHSNIYCMLCKYMKQHSLLVNHISSYYTNSYGIYRDTFTHILILSHDIISGQIQNWTDFPFHHIWTYGKHIWANLREGKRVESEKVQK